MFTPVIAQYRIHPLLHLRFLSTLNRTSTIQQTSPLIHRSCYALHMRNPRIRIVRQHCFDLLLISIVFPHIAIPFFHIFVPCHHDTPLRLQACRCCRKLQQYLVHISPGTILQCIPHHLLAVQDRTVRLDLLFTPHARAHQQTQRPS